MGDVIQMPTRYTDQTAKAFTCGCGGQTFWALVCGDMVCCECRHINTPIFCAVRPGVVLPES